MNKYFSHKIKDDFNIINFNSSIEQEDIQQVFLQIENVCKNRKIIFNLEKVNFINSTFIGYMYHLFETSKNMWGYFCMISINDNIKDAFNLIWVYDIIPFYKDLKEALLKIQK